MFITEYFDVHAAESKVKLNLNDKINPSPFLIKNIFMPNSFSLNKPNKNNSNPRVINLQKLYIHVLHSTSLRLQY